MNDNNKSKQQQISDDELWIRAGNGQPISRDDMGIDSPSRSDALQSLNEGFNAFTFDYHEKKKKHDNDDI